MTGNLLRPKSQRAPELPIGAPIVAAVEHYRVGLNVLSPGGTLKNKNDNRCNELGIVQTIMILCF